MLIEGLLIALVVLIGAIFLLGGALLLKGVASHLWERWSAFFAAHASRHWVATTGTIERAVVTYTSGRGGRVYEPAIRYAYVVADQRLVSQQFAFATTSGVGDEGLVAARAVVQRFRAGSVVQVFYDAEAPKRATLDRSVPPIVGPTLGWSFALVGCALAFFLGGTIVLGAFEDPPDLGDVPPLSAQFGGLAAALGGLFVLVAGVRFIRGEERRQRRLLRFVQAAKSALVHEVRAGELVAVSGRAEAFASTPEEGEEAGEDELPFAKGPLVHYEIDAEWYRRTSCSDFEVRDTSGAALVELREPDSMFVRSERLRIEGEVERFLDEQQENGDEPFRAYPMWLGFGRIRSGDRVLVVGRAATDDDELAFRANQDDPSSLFVADGARDEVVQRLSRSVQRTNTLFLLGAGLVVAGAVALVV